MSVESAEQQRFNLVDEPWVRVELSDGATVDMGLAEVFAASARIERLAGESPTQDFAVLRLLLAVLRRAIGWPGEPGLDDETQWWRELWSRTDLPSDVADYLGAMSDRFWLFGGLRPFYQVADLQYEKAGRLPDPVVGLLPDIPPGRVWFMHRDPASCSVLTAAEAARWLVHLQAFDVAGIKSGTAGDPRVKSGKIYPMGTAWAGALGGIHVQGATLRETLLLNLAPGLPVALLDDMPAWEREQASAGAGEREPSGPVDVLTWQSRRVRLVPDGQGAHAIGLILTYGERLQAANRHTVEYLSQWRRSEAQAKKLRMPEVLMPKRHDPGRALWRGLPSILGAAGDATAAPGCVKGLELLIGSGLLPDDFPIRVVATGLAYGPQDSVIADSYYDTLDFEVGAISDPEHIHLVTRAAEAADRAAAHIGRFGKDLHDSAGGHKDQAQAARERARGRALAAFDPLFRQWVGLLSTPSEVNAEVRWQILLAHASLVVAAEMLAQVPDSAWIGTLVGAGAGTGGWSSAPAAETRLRSQLRKDLPLAHPEEEKR